MLYYDRSDFPQGIDNYKASGSKERNFCHY